jgi:hypothetical protein
VCIELHKKFDVAEVTTEVADKLRKHELTIKGIQSKAIYEIGEELKAAQQELANHRNGMFYAWCESIGMKITSVKNILGYHDFISQNLTNKDILETLPKSLVYEAGKKSAPAELTQKVLDGEITTHKQWQEEMKAMKERTEQAERAKEEAERRAEQAEQANEALSAQYDEQAEQLQDLRNNPQVVEVPTEPSDYQTLKLDVESLTSTNERLRRELAKAQAHQEGKSLQQKAEEDAAFAEYIKTKHQEADAADTFDRAISKLDMLPNDLPEVKEYCRCYLAHHATEVNRAFLMKSTAQKIRLNIRKLEAALEMFETGKLEVIK